MEDWENLVSNKGEEVKRLKQKEIDIRILKTHFSKDTTNDEIKTMSMWIFHWWEQGAEDKDGKKEVGSRFGSRPKGLR